MNSQNLEVDGDAEINGRITNLTDPDSAQDAATKAYVDALEAKVMDLQGVKDIDNNRYEIVTIGSQTWMAENLKATRYNDGAVIPLITNSVSWQSASTTGEPAYTWYQNTASGYGALYNYFVVADTSSRNVCPVGRHVPSDSAWTILIIYLGGIGVAGGKMKEAGLAHWKTPNTGATNESGIAGLPGGLRRNNGTFESIGFDGGWWSSSESNAADAWNRHQYYNVVNDNRLSTSKGYGLSVRCLRD